MSQLAGTAFGIGTPYPLTQSPWGFSPYAGQGFGGQAFPQQSYGPILSNPFVGGNFGSVPFGGNFGSMPYGIGTVSPLQQIAQMLQIVPQQLQQVQLLQQQQLVHLQQLLQIVPAQLQLLLQLVPHQVQQLQQQWQPVGAGISSPFGFGLVPQTFAGPATGHVM